MMQNVSGIVTVLTLLTAAAGAEDSQRSIIGTDVIFAERDGLLTVEAEHFSQQTATEQRAFRLATADEAPETGPDGDPVHIEGASGGAYLEVLPDTRRTHDDKLIRGENFSPDPGKMAVLHYRIHVSTPGRYYVWVRAYSTGSEDNGLHVGIDGEWPASGQRLQWCAGKHSWRWESKQRTQEEHCGEPHLIFLDIEEPGEHTIQFSMREDGFEFDKWLMTLNHDLDRPVGPGPDSLVHAGTLPKPFRFVATEFPAHWGDPPTIQTRDVRPLPGGFGRGSSTLLSWIQENLARDAEKTEPLPEPQVEDLPEDSPTTPVSRLPLILPRKPDGDGSVSITGELKQWHKVTLTLDGPFAHEQDNEPNPFVNYDLSVTFTHESGSPSCQVPGYFAADGDAANTSAESGTKWRAHLSPDRTGTWNYQISFAKGTTRLSTDNPVSEFVKPYHGMSGTFTVAASDKTGRDLRAHGRLQYVGRHYLQFAGSKEYFLKAGADAPETLLGYADFDNTVAGKPDRVPLKTWTPHIRDWNDGDPTWKNGKGRGLIGAVNYLSGKGCNAFSFLTYNAGGDGDNVWPFIQRNDKLHYDCSKLDQWGIVFDHGTAKGMYLHFKMQETENDDHIRGKNAGNVPESLDGGNLGVQRKLYCRELIARFGHNLALNWNLGEENTQSATQQKHMIDWIAELDPYHHNIVVHTFPDQQEKIYRELMGDRSQLTGVSLQNSGIRDTHRQTVRWVRESANAGKPWIVAFDESGTAAHGQCPDLGYKGYDGKDRTGKMTYTEHEVRRQTLWGTLMGGGAGVEYYFGYQYVENDLVCEDWRSRDRSWDYCRIALDFFRDNNTPFQDMQPADELVGNQQHDNSRYCFARPGELYVIYLPDGGSSELDLTEADGRFRIQWYNPRTGGILRDGSVKEVSGGSKVSIGMAADDKEDWVALIRKG